MWESGHEEQEKTCNRVVFTSEEREKRKKKKTVPKTQFLLLGTKPKLSLLYIGKVKLFSMIAKLCFTLLQLHSNNSVYSGLNAFLVQMHKLFFLL